MNLLPKDILAQICARLDNKTLEKLSRTSLWQQVRSFLLANLFHKSRVENLIGNEIEADTNIDWLVVYNFLESNYDKRPWILSDVVDCSYDLVQYANKSGLRSAVKDCDCESFKLLLQLEELDLPTHTQLVKLAVELRQIDMVRLLAKSAIDNSTYSYREARSTQCALDSVLLERRVKLLVLVFFLCWTLLCWMLSI